MDVGYLDAIPDVGEFWPRIQTPEMFISASDLVKSDCSNTVWRWCNSSEQNEAFDLASFLFAFYIMASYEYVKT